MWPMLRLAVAAVAGMALLSNDPASGAWPLPYSVGWPLQYGVTYWQAINMLQQQVYLLQMKVDLLQRQSSKQQRQIEELLSLKETVTLLETALGVNLTEFKPCNGTEGEGIGQRTINERLTTVEMQQQDIMAQQETFRNQHEAFNQSIQTLTDKTDSLEDRVNENAEDIDEHNETLIRHEQHGVQLDEQAETLMDLAEQLQNHSEHLLSLLNETSANTILIGETHATLNESFATQLNIHMIQIDLKLEEQEDHLSAIDAYLRGIDRQLYDHSRQLRDLREHARRLDALERRVTSVEEDVASLKEKKQAAFSARCSECGDVDVGKNGVVKYDIVETNIGGRYSPSTGCFTAPHPGMYVFFTSLRSSNRGNFMTVGIFQGDRNLMEATADTYVHPWNRGSALVTTHLDEGNVVCIKHSGGEHVINSSNFTTFSGWLVDADN